MIVPFFRTIHTVIGSYKLRNGDKSIYLFALPVITTMSRVIAKQVVVNRTDAKKKVTEKKKKEIEEEIDYEEMFNMNDQTTSKRAELFGEESSDESLNEKDEKREEKWEDDEKEEIKKEKPVGKKSNRAKKQIKQGIDEINMAFLSFLRKAGIDVDPLLPKWKESEEQARIKTIVEDVVVKSKAKKAKTLDEKASGKKTNAWMLYLSETRKDVIEEMKEMDQYRGKKIKSQDVSREAGKKWHHEKEDTRQKYIKQCASEKSKDEKPSKAKKSNRKIGDEQIPPRYTPLDCFLKGRIAIYKTGKKVDAELKKNCLAEWEDMSCEEKGPYFLESENMKKEYNAYMRENHSDKICNHTLRNGGKCMNLRAPDSMRCTKHKK